MVVKDSIICSTYTYLLPYFMCRLTLYLSSTNVKDIDPWPVIDDAVLVFVVTALLSIPVITPITTLNLHMPLPKTPINCNAAQAWSVFFTAFLTGVGTYSGILGHSFFPNGILVLTGLVLVSALIPVCTNEAAGSLGSIVGCIAAGSKFGTSSILLSILGGVIGAFICAIAATTAIVILFYVLLGLLMLFFAGLIIVLHASIRLLQNMFT